ncbi:MAG: CBS domain-containing protein [Desulfobacterales bacterium]|nr:CBS domain-containing protein [Deltaproteobacteria bacterium]NNK96367.1 CBS domain-containing protein [Desulfobacterales bacterium]
MPLNKQIRDIMVPITEYVTTREDRTLKEAVLDLRKIYCKVETDECTKAGRRTCLVLDSDSTLTGIIDFQSILKTLIPEIAGGIGEKLASLEKSVALAESGVTEMDKSNAGLAQRVLTHAETRVGDMMLRVRGKGIQADDHLIESLRTMHRLKVTVMPVYDENKLVGVLQDSDLFLAVADILNQ